MKKGNIFNSTTKKLWEQQLEKDPSLYNHIPEHLDIPLPETIRDKLQAQHPEVELLFMTEDVFDEAIIGVIEHYDEHAKKNVKAVQYDHSKVIEANIKLGMTEEEALEYFDYNQGGAYVGEQTPQFKYEDYGEEE